MISGTLQFILKGKDASPHRLDDDTESIFWVAYWYLLIYYAELSTEEVGDELREVFDYSKFKSGRFVGGKFKISRLYDIDELLVGFHRYPGIQQWVTAYARHLAHLQLNRQTYLPRPEKILDSQTLRSTVFDLADDIPHDIIKRVPDWKGLRMHRRPELGSSEPANFSDDATLGLGMQVVSHGTMPTPFSAAPAAS